MELKVTQENFLKALQNVSRVAQSRTSLPILNNILIRTEKNRLLIASTNLEIAITSYIRAKIIQQGEITVPAKLITEYIQNLPKSPISLKVDKNKLNIITDNFKSSIIGTNSDDFPELPYLNDKNEKLISFSIESSVLKESINQTINTTSNDLTRPILTGIYMYNLSNKIYLCSTDGYRLAEKNIIKSNNNIDIVIPVFTLQEVLRILRDDVSEVKININENEVYFELDDTLITSRLIEGSFPDYKKLIPEKFSIHATVIKDELLKIAKVANLFSRNSGGGVVLILDVATSLLTINSIASEYGENSSNIKIENANNNGKITINSKYLIDALSVIPDKKITIEFNGKLSPLVIKGTENKNFLYLIMPLKS